ncbi:MAG: type II toxin-antitoxin system VapC family toxin [Actinobacteria bacterium]|nr:type II toxin-antitoxin system VapC family toxin [Actinomycetota bacterium]
MVAKYFDTSSVVALVLDEPASARARREWELADSCASVELLYVEGRSALARAAERGRVSDAQRANDRRSFEDLVGETSDVALTRALIHRAGDLAAAYALRAYDAVHLAAAESLSADTVFVSGDHRQCSVAQMLGLPVVRL